jgi:dephospho-CoA kinase
MIIGVTGRMGSGKTTVVKLFKKWGAKVIYVDRIGWAILPKVKETLVKEFGKNIISGDCINRKKLAQIAFSSLRNKEKLDQIVGSRIVHFLENVLKKINPSYYVVVDCALIYEWNIGNWFNKIILIDAEDDKIIERLKLKGYSTPEILSRLKYQLPTEKKNPHYLINNNFSFSHLQKQAYKLWHRFQGI